MEVFLLQGMDLRFEISDLGADSRWAENAPNRSAISF